MIFVTGGTGIVGSHLLFELANSGKKIKALKRADSNMRSVQLLFNTYSRDGADLFNAIEWVNGDILDREILREVIMEGDEIYHVAALVSYNPRKSGKMHVVNVEGTSNMVNIALEKKVAKFCHVSSVAVLGGNFNPYSGLEGNSAAITEDLNQGTIHRHSPYAITKLAAEREVWRAVAEGLNAVIVNPGIVFGPGNWGASSNGIVATVWNGIRFYPPGVIGFVDARDVAKAMIQLVEKNISNERFILISENLPYREVFRWIADALKVKRPPLAIHPFFLELFWRFEWLRSNIFRTRPLITQDLAQPSCWKLYYSNEKICRALDFKFIPVKQSVFDTCNVLSQWRSYQSGLPAA